MRKWKKNQEGEKAGQWWNILELEFQEVEEMKEEWGWGRNEEGKKWAIKWWSREGSAGSRIPRSLSAAENPSTPLAPRTIMRPNPSRIFVIFPTTNDFLRFPKPVWWLPVFLRWFASILTKQKSSGKPLKDAGATVSPLLREVDDDCLTLRASFRIWLELSDEHHRGALEAIIED